MTWLMSIMFLAAGIICVLSPFSFQRTSFGDWLFFEGIGIACLAFSYSLFEGPRP